MRLTEKLGAILFPYRCCVCGKLMPPGETLCKECVEYRADISKIYVCDVCGTDKRQCRHKRLLFEKLAPAFFYEGAVRGAIAKFKFRSKPGLSVPFARYMAESMETRKFPEDIDCITYIPMTSRQRRKRGYNQGELLARELSKITGIEYRPLLLKLYETSPQHKNSYIRRQGSLLGCYEVDMDMLPFVKGKKILIADDVCTSGHTMNEAAKTLLIFGAESVYCTSFAMTRYKKSKK